MCVSLSPLSLSLSLSLPRVCLSVSLSGRRGTKLSLALGFPPHDIDNKPHAGPQPADASALTPPSSPRRLPPISLRRSTKLNLALGFPPHDINEPHAWPQMEARASPADASALTPPSPPRRPPPRNHRLPASCLCPGSAARHPRSARSRASPDPARARENASSRSPPTPSGRRRC